jgi:glycolate oxidase
VNAPLPAAACAEPTSRAQRQAEVLAVLQPLLPAHALLWHSEDTVPYECDGLTAYREQPLLVALPETEAQVAAVLRGCHALKVPVVARGAGTGLSGGALPHRLGVTLSLAKFSNAACATWPSAKPRRRWACTTRPTRAARSPARSAATWPRTPAACIA